MRCDRSLAVAGLLAVLALAAAGSAEAAACCNFTLPASLPYPTDKFEPSIDNMTMNLHFFKHANAFVTNLNTALATCPELFGRSLYTLNTQVGNTRACSPLEATITSRLIGLVIRAGRCPIIPPKCWLQVRNAAGGFWNHGLFFLHNLAPFGSQKYERDASPALKQAIWQVWGSEAKFREAFSAAAAGVFGSGWTWLSYDPRTKKLKIQTTPNQDNPLQALPGTQQGFPILGLDKYYNVRASYIAAFYDVINWKGVSAAFAKAKAGTFSSLDVLKPAANWQASG
ncbi:hypothetical protein ABPG75_011491 [Micractinium tetrahymenae]